jgi:hypothetical protein
MIFSCVVSFQSKKKKIPDLSLPPCILKGLDQGTRRAMCLSRESILGPPAQQAKTPCKDILMALSTGFPNFDLYLYNPPKLQCHKLFGLGIGADFDLNGDIFDIEMWRFEQ